MSSSSPPRGPLANRPPDPVEGETTQPSAARLRLPRGWLIALGVLAVVLVVSVVVLISVVRPPSYEPVPIPSVSST